MKHKILADEINLINKISIIIFFLFLFYNGNALSENSDELYQKIDLFSEVLEKIQQLINYR